MFHDPSSSQEPYYGSHHDDDDVPAPSAPAAPVRRSNSYDPSMILTLGDHHDLDDATSPSSPSGASLMMDNHHNNNHSLDDDDDNDSTTNNLAAGTITADDGGAAIVRNIASFLTLSDAASLTSRTRSMGGLTDYLVDTTNEDDDDDDEDGDNFDVQFEEEQLQQQHHNFLLYQRQQQQQQRQLQRARINSSSDDLVTTTGYDTDGSYWSVPTPLTPALVAISPTGATPHSSYRPAAVDLPTTTAADRESHAAAHDNNMMLEGDDVDDDEDNYMENLLRSRRRRWAQEKVAAAVFCHPRSLRSFCVDAYTAASDIRKQKEQEQLQRLQSISESTTTTTVGGGDAEDPETLVEPCASATQTPAVGMTTTTVVKKRKRGRRNKDTNKNRVLFVIHHVVDWIFHNVPLSVLMDVIDATGDTALDTTCASFHITTTSINIVMNRVGYTIHTIWDFIINFNPFSLLEAIISLQVNAMGKTSEVLVSGIQSVATGVGSASSMALHRLSVAKSASGPHHSSYSGPMTGAAARHNAAQNEKLLKHMSALNEAALVLAYTEIADDSGGLTRHAKHRLSKMMHYDVSLRPFVATVTVSPNSGQYAAYNNMTGGADRDANSVTNSTASSPTSSPGSPFMYNQTPQSFPPTPHSRRRVLDCGSRFANDVVYQARDRLRVHGHEQSDNERTREMARALKEGKRLAVFNANDAVNGVELMCGQHIVTKVGHTNFGTTRSMVPVLRNVLVYFEFVVMPRPRGNYPPGASLSIGLSTEEMPPNTLVGSWQGSVGLCSTGQVFTSGQWCSPVDASRSAFGENYTVGCLVRLDDGTAFDYFDGVKVTASVTFIVRDPLGNSLIVPSPAFPLPVSGQPLGATATAVSSPSEQSAGDGDNDEPVSIPVAPPPPSAAAVVTGPLSLLVPVAEELYPTVTLHSHATAVMCRFSAEDIENVSRASIGAPGGVTVYAVDGSVILNEQE